MSSAAWRCRTPCARSTSGFPGVDAGARQPRPRLVAGGDRGAASRSNSASRLIRGKPGLVDAPLPAPRVALLDFGGEDLRQEHPMGEAAPGPRSSASAASSLRMVGRSQVHGRRRRSAAASPVVSVERLTGRPPIRSSYPAQDRGRAGRTVTPRPDRAQRRRPRPSARRRASMVDERPDRRCHPRRRRSSRLDQRSVGQAAGGARRTSISARVPSPVPESRAAPATRSARGRP